jgi:phosphoribosylaminoimidazole carboxylase PurE protein
MRSDSDLPVMKKTADVLRTIRVPYFMTVASAHRTPEKVLELAQRAEKEDWKVLIAGAGMAAHLAGFLAAHTILPVIGVPMASSPLGGLDALLSTVQMPGGFQSLPWPLGLKNAALFAIQIGPLPMLLCKETEYRKQQRDTIQKKAAAVEEGRK